MCTITITFDKNENAIWALVDKIKQLGAHVEDYPTSSYTPEILDKVAEGDIAYNEGNYKVVNIQDLWK